jgi:hypothetical protein
MKFWTVYCTFVFLFFSAFSILHVDVDDGNYSGGDDGACSNNKNNAAVIIGDYSQLVKLITSMENRITDKLQSMEHHLATKQDIEDMIEEVKKYVHDQHALSVAQA